MMMPETKNGVLFELGAWENIIKSTDWKVFRDLLKAHMEHLQKEVNNEIRLNGSIKAGQALRAMDDCKKMLDLVTKRVSELTKESEKGG